MLVLRLALIPTTWALAWFISIPVDRLFPGLAGLLLVLSVGCSGSIVAVCL